MAENVRYIKDLSTDVNFGADSVLITESNGSTRKISGQKLANALASLALITDSTGIMGKKGASVSQLALEAATAALAMDNQSKVINLELFTNYISEDIYGIEVDTENDRITRVAAAENLQAGADFDGIYEMRRCNVSDNGVVNAYYGDEGYTEDGSNGQVMVEIPAMYYKVAPIKLMKISDTASSKGYHNIKSRYYITRTPHTGFKLHPAFYDENGKVCEKIYVGAYEACLYDTSAAAYNTDDSQTMDASADLLSSIAGVKPTSGKTQNFTRVNAEQTAKNRGTGWHNQSAKVVSLIQLLFAVEYASFNWQSALGQGVTGISDDSTNNCSSLTGSTSSLGNTSGNATATINEKGGVRTIETDAVKVAISWRGIENFFGNIWKFVNGISFWGDGQMQGGEPYICSDFSYVENKKDGNYAAVGFYLPASGGYIKNFGYSEEFDWLFIPSRTGGHSAMTVAGDNTWVTENLNGYRIAQLGGRWTNWSSAGAFGWSCNNGVGFRYRAFGGRLVYASHGNEEDAA